MDWSCGVEGVRTLLYGPQGALNGFVYSTIDEKGNPNVNNPVGALTQDQVKSSGIGQWANFVGSQLWDDIKYAVNDKQSADKQDYATATQQNILSKHLYYDDASFGFSTLIDPDSDLSMLQTNCNDLITKAQNNAKMASSEEECRAILDKMKTDLYNMGYAKIEQAYTQKYQANIAILGN